MEELIARFSHIAKQIFEQLDNKSLTNSREVSKSWQKFIDDKNLSWARIVNIPTTLLRGNRYVYHEFGRMIEIRDGYTYMHLAAQTGTVC